ncbi:hypothetical protein BDZ97DRAFT_1760032 [Flammula alnicola]|nr:hypothetical protein BDZ97DRAFT_1760032 [Flammula alnicola]
MVVLPYSNNFSSQKETHVNGVPVCQPDDDVHRSAVERASSTILEPKHRHGVTAAMNGGDNHGKERSESRIRWVTGRNFLISFICGYQPDYVALENIRPTSDRRCNEVGAISPQNCSHSLFELGSNRDWGHVYFPPEETRLSKKHSSRNSVLPTPADAFRTGLYSSQPSVKQPSSNCVIGVNDRQFAANSPRGILRTTVVIESFKQAPACPGGPSSILQFGILLENGEFNILESLEVARPILQPYKFKQQKQNEHDPAGYLFAKCTRKQQARTRPLVNRLIIESFKNGHLVDTEPVVDIFMSQNMIQPATSMLDALKGNKPEQGHLQTHLNLPYELLVVGKFCEARDPYLAYIAYAKGLCDEELVAITNDNSMSKQQACYLLCPTFGSKFSFMTMFTVAHSLTRFWQLRCQNARILMTFLSLSWPSCKPTFQSS